MRKVLIGIGAVVVLLVVAVLAIPRLIPVDTVRDKVIAAVKTATGRDLSIGGQIETSVFPALSVKLSDVALSNPPGYSDPQLARIGGIEAHLRLLPLLAGRVELGSFVIDKPQIGLETDREGRPNWIFGQAAAPAAAPAAQAPSAPAAPPAASSGSGGARLSGVWLGDVRIVDGVLTYRDDRTGKVSKVDGINLSLSQADPDSVLSAKGALNWQGKAVSLTADIAAPSNLLSGQSSDADLGIASDPIKFSLKGAFQNGAKPSASGDIDLSIPSLRDLAQWLTGQPLAAPGTGLGPLAITGHVVASSAAIAFTDAKIGLDKMNATGNLTVALDGPHPSLKGQLAVDDLDLNPYLPPKSGGSGASSGGSAPGSGSATAGPGWSDTPIDTSPLKLVDADLDLSAGSFEVHDIKIGKSVLHVTDSDGKLVADLSQLTLYGGSAKGQVAIEPAGNGVGINEDFTFQGVQAEPLLEAVAGFDRLSGTVSGHLAVTGQGASQRAIVATLGGQCALDVGNGAVKGIDLADMVRNVESAFTGGSGSQQTVFSRLSGTCTIAKGVLTNKDLSLQSSALQVSGSGTAALLPRTLDYRVEPKVAELAGVTVPIDITGPWDHLSYKPDLAGAATNAVGSAINKAVPGISSLPFGNLFGK